MENDLQLATDPHARGAARERLHVVPQDRDSAAVGRREPHDLEQRGRLAAARFADERERLAFAQIESHAVDGLDRADSPAQQAAAREREVAAQILDAEHDLALLARHARELRRQRRGHWKHVGPA